MSAGLTTVRTGTSNTVYGRQQVLFRRNCQQNIQKTFSRFDGQQRVILRNLERETTKIKNEEENSRKNVSHLSTYFANDDFKKLTTDITDEQRIRRHFRTLLGRNPPTSGCSCIHKSSCSTFPCQRLKSYHFIFREIRNPDEVQAVRLMSPVEDTKEIPRIPYGNSNKMCREKGASTRNTIILKGEKRGEHTSLTRAKTVIGILPSNDAQLNKKELFLRCAVLRRRLNDSDRKFIVRAVNYGAPVPWRALKKPAMLGQTYGTEFGGKKRLLTF